MKTPHKHAALIKAWADGAEIEFKDMANWSSIEEPSWADEFQYRIKPEPKPDVVRWCVATFGIGHEEYNEETNLKVTLCGTTGKLKSAEVL